MRNIMMAKNTHLSIVIFQIRIRQCVQQMIIRRLHNKFYKSLILKDIFLGILIHRIFNTKVFQI